VYGGDCWRGGEGHGRRRRRRWGRVRGGDLEKRRRQASTQRRECRVQYHTFQETIDHRAVKYAPSIKIQHASRN